jgi:hypothetical protein
MTRTGNLGQDAVANFDSFPLDFARMTFRLGNRNLQTRGIGKYEFCSIEPLVVCSAWTRAKRKPYSAFSVTHRDTAVTHLRGANLTDSATSQFRTPEITTVFPAINPR